MQTATNPVTGERLTLQNGQWVPLVENTPAPVQAATPRPRPAPVRQPQAPAPTPVAPAAPAANDLGISASQEMESLVRQGYSLEEAQRFASQPESTGPAMPEAPISSAQTATNPETGEVLTLQNGQWVPAAPASTGYDLPEGVLDYESLTDDQRNNLTRGTRVLLPADAPGQSRQIVTLARDMNAPQRDAIMGEDQQTFGGVKTYVPGMADAVAAFASGAAEQVPGLDEGINLADALMSSGSFSDSRDEYQLMQQALNRSNRGERTAGGLAGFAGSLVLPGSVGIKGLQGMSGAARTAAAAAGAAPLGAAYGFASGEGSAADRAPGAVLGSLLGGGAAGVLDAGVRAAPNIASGLSEAGSVISRGLGRAPREAEITPRATESARQYVARLLESSGSDLTGNPVAGMGKPITAAEAIGPSGVSNMAALTRRAGRAGTMAQGQLGARAVEQSNRVVQDFADLTGMDPAGSADMIQNLADAGRKKAAPLYEAAYAQPVTLTPNIQSILSRPAGQNAMQRAQRIAANEGQEIDIQNPTMQTLDYVKRGLDDVLNSYRDPVTRRLNLDEEGRGVQNVLRGFRDELVTINPAYGEALQAGGDPIRLEEAFSQADRLFQVGTPQRTFNTAIERMGEAERNALVAGYADRLFREAQAGRLTTRQLNQVNVPVTREKLATLIGPEGADSFMQRITAEIDLARTGGRMAPGTNSVTAEALEAMRDQDQGVGLGADFARALTTSNGNVINAALSTAGKAVAAPIAGFVRGATAPASQPVRDEIARLLLMPPDDLAAMLSQSGDLSRREATDLAAALQRASPQAAEDEFAFPPIATQRAGRGGRQ